MSFRHVGLQSNNKYNNRNIREKKHLQLKTKMSDGAIKWRSLCDEMAVAVFFCCCFASQYL